jgi:hypothetical protein
MTGTGGEVTGPAEPRPEDAAAEGGSRLQQYRKRTEEWASALRDSAEQHAPPELLSGLARTARNLAQYLEGMAESARARQADKGPVPQPEEQPPEPTEQPREPVEQPPEATQQGEGAPQD